MKLDLTEERDETIDSGAYTMTVTIPPLVVTMSREAFDADGDSAAGAEGLARFMAESLHSNPYSALMQFIGDWYLQENDDEWNEWASGIEFDLSEA